VSGSVSKQINFPVASYSYCIATLRLSMLPNLRHGSTNWWKINKNKNRSKFSCGCYCYFHVCHFSE